MSARHNKTAVISDLPSFFRRLPKVEAHLHLDGTLRPRLIGELARAQGHPLGSKTQAEIERIAVVGKPRDSLKQVLDAFQTIYPLMRTPQAMERVAYELCREVSANGIVYFETRFAPALNASINGDVDQVLDAVLKGLNRGKKNFGVSSGVIITMLRDWPKKANEKMFEAALRYKGRGIVALDLANDESAAGLNVFADLYQEAHRQGLASTVHAGEVFPSPDLALALDLNVRRIGHGVFLPRYPELLQEYARRKIPIEVNLTSNLRTSAIRRYKDHPLLSFLELGIPVVLGTDDPGIFGIDLTHEYEVAAREFGLSEADMKLMAEKAVDCLFLDPAKKIALRKKMKSAF